MKTTITTMILVAAALEPSSRAGFDTAAC